MTKDLFACTCVTAGLITACARHDTIIFNDDLPALFDDIPSLNRIVEASAHLKPAFSPKNRVVEASAYLTQIKTPPAAPFSGPPGDLFALTHLIDTRPTTEQWQTIKRLILSLERT